MRTLAAVVVALTAMAASGVARSADYYLSNKPGSGSGTKDDPFGLADLPQPDNKPTRPLAVLRPGDTLYFKGGVYALRTGPAKNFYYVGYLRPVRSGEPGKPISFSACPGETVVLTTASGGQPILGNLDRDYVRYEGFVVKGSIGHVGGRQAEIAFCEVVGRYVDTSDNHDGIRIEHAEGAWVHHNVIHGVQGRSLNSAGIKVYKSDNILVEDNYIYDNTAGIFDKDSGTNNTYRRNYLTRNRLAQFHGNNQGKHMVAHLHDNLIDGGFALGFRTDGSDVHDNLIRGDVLAGHWAGELWNTRLWNNVVIAKGRSVSAYNESQNRFVGKGPKKHLAYMDYNVYTAAAKYSFGAYAAGGGQVFGMEQMRSHGFERHSQVVAGASEIFKSQQSWELLPKWRTAGKDGDAVGPENVPLILDLKRYGPAGRDYKGAPARKAVTKGPFPLGAGQGRKVEILAYDNGGASPWVEFFAFDSPSHPKLAQLRAEYKLDQVVKGSKTDLERAVALKRWVGAHWRFATPEPETFRDWSAVALLERGKRGKWGWCGQAAMLFQQACMAVGLPSRFIELGRPDTPACHFTTEVYLREQGKWAVVDATPLPDADLYYAVDGVPQSALEMHRHVAAGAMDEVREVHPGHACKVESRKSFAWSFYYLRWLTRCDVVTNTPKFVDMENTFDRRWHTVEWVDAQTVPWESQKYVVPWMRNERLSAWTTSDPEVVYWKPSDRVRMVVRPGKRHLFVHLWSADLDFDHFETAVDGRPWERLPKANVNREPRFGWSSKRFSMEASPGVHEARVRLVRRAGTRGPESFVRLRVE